MIFAYLDPGSGSLILQAVLGGVAGIGVAGKAMRNRLRARRAAKQGPDKEPEEFHHPTEEEQATRTE